MEQVQKSYKSLPEDAIVDGPGDASHGVGSLLASLRISDSDFAKKFVSHTWPLITHSVPTLILGLQNALIIAAAGIWKAPAAFPDQEHFELCFPYQEHFVLCFSDQEHFKLCFPSVSC